MPTYSGGLGILAGDTIRSAADLMVPMVAVTLLHRKGYFRQRIDAGGWQHEEPVDWPVEKFLKDQTPRITVTIEGRVVQVRAWRYDTAGVGGYFVPVYLLDTDLPENAEQDRHFTDYLYGGDKHYRLCQEVILGIGGVKMFRALGYGKLTRFHMNEGHASLLTVELLDEQARSAGRTQITHEDIAAVRSLCVFTTHTPVPAGHDKFPLDLVDRVLGRPELLSINEIFHDDVLNVTHLALTLSHYVNGVTKKHGEISRLMYAPYVIDAITNGVHAGTWTAKPFQDLFDRYIPGWRHDNFSLRYALSIPKSEVWQAHETAKRHLIETVNQQTGLGLSPDTFTLGFARRAATYKRADLLFYDIERLKDVVSKAGPLQVIYAGKAHPNDQQGKELIQRIFRAKEQLKDAIKIAYLENYGMELGKLITAGVDIWLNNPQPPLEASGTSGMKAALNGVPSLSVLDGWWIEGHIEWVTGWSIGEGALSPWDQDRSSHDATSLYEKLEHIIMPLFYLNRDRFIDIMRHAIMLNGSFFNTQRMVQQYVVNAYYR